MARMCVISNKGLCPSSGDIKRRLIINKSD
jgi:hypothetical protein